jgi:hypothetical protein
MTSQARDYTDVSKTHIGGARRRNTCTRGAAVMVAMRMRPKYTPTHCVDSQQSRVSRRIVSVHSIDHHALFSPKFSRDTSTTACSTRQRSRNNSQNTKRRSWHHNRTHTRARTHNSDVTAARRRRHQHRR